MSGDSSGVSSITTKKFKPTSQNNPFFTSTTDKNGNTVTNFAPNTAGKTVYDFTNDNLQQLLDSYLKPNYNDPYFTAARAMHDQEMNRSLNENVLNPLVANNMIRSSQATNMYNNLAKQSSDYANQLMLDWDNRMKDKINNLYDLYVKAATGASGQESTSINSSLGAGTSKTTSSN